MPPSSPPVAATTSENIVPVAAPYSPRTTRHDIASWILTGILLFLVLRLHLLSALLGGLLVYELVYLLAPTLHRLFSNERAKLVVLGGLSTLVVGLISFVILAAVAFFRGDAGHLPMLLQKMAEIVEGARGTLPTWILEHLPDRTEDLQVVIVDWLRRHAGEVQLAGKEAGRVLVHMLIGMIIGAMISLREALPHDRQAPLARALTQRTAGLGMAFRNIVFAQVRISAINTIFTALYLVVLLPLFGVHLPLTKTMIVVTFIAGLLPVLGNLISNTVIVIVSLSHSLPAALGSLAFLVLIHKAEYFLNARIIGQRIKARAWELLLAMLLMEAAFGIAGVIAAPIYYAYLKTELKQQGLI